MTNRLAIILGFIIFALAAVDLILFGSQHAIYLGKKLFALVEWIAFWR